jgi:hypothetical protein
VQVGAAQPPASAESPLRVLDYRALSLSSAGGSLTIQARLEAAPARP